MWYLGSWMSSTSSDITWWWKNFPRHQHARHATTFSTTRWRICSLLMNDHSMVGPFHPRPTASIIPTIKLISHELKTIIFVSLRPSFAILINYKPTYNQPYCAPHLRHYIKPINYRPTHNPTLVCIFVLVIPWYFHRAYYQHGFSRIYAHYWGQQNLNLTALWQYDSCGTQGCA